MRFLMVPMDKLLAKPVLDQGLDVFRFQGPSRHAPIAQRMELVGHQGQHALAFDLGGIAAFPALAAELFELVVQVSHRVLSFWLVFLTTWQPKLTSSLTRNGHGAQPPIRPDNAWSEATRVFLGRGTAPRNPTCPSTGVLECG